MGADFKQAERNFSNWGVFAVLLLRQRIPASDFSGRNQLLVIGVSDRDNIVVAGTRARRRKSRTVKSSGNNDNWRTNADD